MPDSASVFLFPAVIKPCVQKSEGSKTLTTDNVIVRNYCQLSDRDLTLHLSQQGDFAPNRVS